MKAGEKLAKNFQACQNYISQRFKVESDCSSKWHPGFSANANLVQISLINKNQATWRLINKQHGWIQPKSSEKLEACSLYCDTFYLDYYIVLWCLVIKIHYLVRLCFFFAPFLKYYILHNSEYQNTATPEFSRSVPKSVTLPTNADQNNLSSWNNIFQQRLIFFTSRNNSQRHWTS